MEPAGRVSPAVLEVRKAVREHPVLGGGQCYAVVEHSVDACQSLAVSIRIVEFCRDEYQRFRHFITVVRGIEARSRTQ